MHATPVTLFLASAAVLAMGSTAQINGQIAALDSADSYCFFLPPMASERCIFQHKQNKKPTLLT